MHYLRLCSSIEAKHSKTVLRIIFLTKANEICRHDYSSKNMLKDVFHFSVSIIELEEIFGRIKKEHFQLFTIFNFIISINTNKIKYACYENIYLYE